MPGFLWLFGPLLVDAAAYVGCNLVHLLMARFWTALGTHQQVIFLYKKLECEHLLQALQSTLVHYPVLLGRIRMDKKNGTLRQFALHAYRRVNNAWISFCF